jgi:hypothetical protein
LNDEPNVQAGEDGSCLRSRGPCVRLSGPSAASKTHPFEHSVSTDSEQAYKYTCYKIEDRGVVVHTTLMRKIRNVFIFLV